MAIVQRLLSLVSSAALSLVTLGPGQLYGGYAAQSATSGVVNVHIDGTQTFQKIDGFGVNANARSWNNGQLAPALDMLVDQMGAHIFRVILEKSDWQASPDTSDTSIYESPKFQNLWGTISYLNSKNVVVMLNLMGTIPEWMGGSTLSTDQEDQWVNMVTSMLSYGRNVRHVQIDLLSPMNEEDIGAPEGPRMSSDQYGRVMHKLSARLAALGMDDIRLVGPDTASTGAAANDYAPVMLSDDALMSQIDHFSVHSYSQDTGTIGTTIEQSRYGDRNFWVTEWSAWCQGCDHGQPVQAEWQFASTTTDLLLDHLEHGASAALAYEGYDSYYEHHGAFSYWGQLEFDPNAGTYSPRQRFFTNAQVFRFVTPGMVRIGSTPSDGDVRVLAFEDPRSGDIAIVGHNSRSSDTNLQLAMQGVQVSGSTLHLYQTTNARNLAQAPDVSVQPDGALAVSVAADGFFTLTTEGPAASQPSSVTSPAGAAATPSADSSPPAGMLLGSARMQPVSDTNPAGTVEAFQGTASSSGSANRLYLYLGPGTTASEVQVGIYADSAGAPGALLASGSRQSLAGGAWNSIEISPVQIAAGTQYWTAVLSPSTGGGSIELLDQGDSGGPSLTGADSGLVTLPAQWASGGQWSSSPISAYLVQAQ